MGHKIAGQFSGIYFHKFIDVAKISIDTKTHDPRKPKIICAFASFLPKLFLLTTANANQAKRNTKKRTYQPWLNWKSNVMPHATHKMLKKMIWVWELDHIGNRVLKVAERKLHGKEESPTTSLFRASSTADSYACICDT